MNLQESTYKHSKEVNISIMVFEKKAYENRTFAKHDEIWKTVWNIWNWNLKKDKSILSINGTVLIVEEMESLAQE